MSTEASGESPRLPIAIAVNLPLMWKDAESIAGSLYVGLTKRLAVRGNVASYKYHGGMMTLAGSIAAIPSGGGDEGEHEGRINDVSVGVVGYSNKMWDGFTMEASLMRRAKDVRTTDDFSVPGFIATESTTYAVRALVGYSWLIGDHVFVAFALGMSGGHEHGSETTRMSLYTSGAETKSVSRWETSAEGYLRFGAAFDFMGGNMRYVPKARAK